MNEITINQLFPALENDATNFECERIKIRFNIDNQKGDPIEDFKSDPDTINTRWLLNHKKRHFFKEKDLAICLVRLNQDKDLWLLTTMKRIDEKIDGVTDDIGYKATEFPDYKSFYGRVIIRYHKSQNQDLSWEKAKNEFIISQIISDVFDDDHFPGYDKVSLSYSKLNAILKKKNTEWINALRNQKAIYVITDINNGKLYVGSATSDSGMLLSRWQSYVENGHGGNNELKSIVKTKGFKYIKDYFQYSIIENYNAKIDDSVILEREKYWKNVLYTRYPHGYNDN